MKASIITNVIVMYLLHNSLSRTPNFNIIKNFMGFSTSIFS